MHRDESVSKGSFAVVAGIYDLISKEFVAKLEHWVGLSSIKGKCQLLIEVTYVTSNEKFKNRMGTAFGKRVSRLLSMSTICMY